MLKALWRMFILPGRTRRRRKRLDNLSDHVLKDLGIEPRSGSAGNIPKIRLPFDPSGWN